MRFLKESDVARVLTEQGIHSEMPVLPYSANYASVGRFGVVDGIGHEGDDLVSFVAEYKLFAESCECYRTGHGLSAPLVQDRMPRYPWQAGVTLTTAARKLCIESHFLSALIRASDPFFVIHLEECSIGIERSGVPGSERWDQVLGQMMVPAMNVSATVGHGQTYPGLFDEVIEFVSNPRGEGSRCDLLTRMLHAAAGRAVTPRPHVCACGCGG